MGKATLSLQGLHWSSILSWAVDLACYWQYSIEFKSAHTKKAVKALMWFLRKCCLQNASCRKIYCCPTTVLTLIVSMVLQYCWICSCVRTVLYVVPCSCKLWPRCVRALCFGFSGTSQVPIQCRRERERQVSHADYSDLDLAGLPDQSSKTGLSSDIYQYLMLFPWSPYCDRVGDQGTQLMRPSKFPAATATTTLRSTKAPSEASPWRRTPDSQFLSQIDWRMRSDAYRQKLTMNGLCWLAQHSIAQKETTDHPCLAYESALSLRTAAVQRSSQFVSSFHRRIQMMAKEVSLWLRMPDCNPFAHFIRLGQAWRKPPSCLAALSSQCGL